MHTFVEHQGEISVDLSKAHPSYLTPLYCQRKGNIQDFPRPGPSTTTHGPPVVVGGVVLTFSIVENPEGKYVNKALDNA